MISLGVDMLDLIFFTFYLYLIFWPFALVGLYTGFMTKRPPGDNTEWMALVVITGVISIFYPFFLFYRIIMKEAYNVPH